MNAQEYSAYLKNVSVLPQVEAYKRQTYALLNIREGGTYLDMGCGTGNDAMRIAELTGTTGEVIGIDTSEERLEEARVQAAPYYAKGLSIKFQHGDAHCLPFADNVFDGCRADRVFQHLQDPIQAFAEMARVAKPEGNVVISEPDWGTLRVTEPYHPLTERVFSILPNGVRNWRMGNDLFALFRHADFEIVNLTVWEDEIQNFETAKEVFRFEYLATMAMDAGVVFPQQVDEWMRTLEEAEKFCISLTMFIACGTKRRVS